MSWFKREDHEIHPTPNHEVRTEGLWVKCDNCRKLIWKADLEANLQVCPHCGFHFRIGSHARRMDMLLEPGYEIVDTGLRSTDPLEFCDLKPYKAPPCRSPKAKPVSTTPSSTPYGHDGRVSPWSSASWNMALSAVPWALSSEKPSPAPLIAPTKTRTPLIIVSASGGARMMEGIASLMQLAKISAGLARLDEARIPYISLMTDPTTGGVTASFAMLGDLNIAEPGALIGFAGPRVIEQTIRQKLPEGFQRSEFLLQHGFLDAVVPRKELKAYLAQALGWMSATRPDSNLEPRQKTEREPEPQAAASEL